MKTANRCSALISFTLVCVAVAANAAEVTTEPVLGCAGPATATVIGAGKAQPPGIAVTSIVYDNTTAPAAASYGVSSTDLAAQWGDRMTTVGTGVINQHVFSFFNSASSAGPVLAATIQVGFFDAVTAVVMGGYSANVTFGSGLNPGFFSIVTVPNLDVNSINLNVTDIVVTQQVTGLIGTANRLGVAIFNPIIVGTSPPSMFIAASTIGGGVPGFYTFPNGPANPAHQITVTVPTVGVEPRTWTGLKDLFR